jgi:hypothetical protein
MAEVYGALGKDLVLDAIARASDVNDIEDCIVRELDRRGISCASAVATADAPAVSAMKDAIHDNCVAAGYANAEATGRLSAAQMQRYIAFIKELYGKIVVP